VFCRGFVPWSKLVTDHTAACVATIPFTSTRAVCSALPGASGRPTGTWRRTAWIRPPHWPIFRRRLRDRALNIHGYHANAERFGPLPLWSDAPAIRRFGRRKRRHWPPAGWQLPYLEAEVVWARVRKWRARRRRPGRRTRALFLNSQAAVGWRARGAIPAEELGKDEQWKPTRSGIYRTGRRIYGEELSTSLGLYYRAPCRPCFISSGTGRCRRCAGRVENLVD